MKGVGYTITAIFGVGAGILMFIFYVAALTKWLGTVLGLVVAFLVAPGAVIFPFIFWLVEGAFPVTYFIIWVIGIIGVSIGTLISESSKN